MPSVESFSTIKKAETRFSRLLHGNLKKSAPQKRNRRLRYVENLRKHSIFDGLAYFRAFLAGVSAVLMARRVENEAPIVVLFTMLCAGALIMRLNGKSRLWELFVERLPETG